VFGSVRISAEPAKWLEKIGWIKGGSSENDSDEGNEYRLLRRVLKSMVMFS
jgi:hypothetical protein